MPRRRSGGRTARRAASRNPPPRPGMENDEIVPNQVHDSNQPIAPYDRVPTHCYHLSGDNEIRSIGGLKSFQIAMSRRATDASVLRNSLNLQSYRRIYGRNNTFDMEERKTFISSGCNHLRQEKLYGITRVSVYGVDTICVVTRNNDLVQLEKDLARLRGTTYRMLMLPKDLISEVEGVLDSLAFP